MEQQHRKIKGVPRKEALSLEEVIPQFLRRMKLASGVNTQRVFAAWDAVSGAAAYTLGRFYRGGRLYVTLSSSMVRGQLDLRKADLVAALNEYLSKDTLFVKDDPRSGFVKELILK